MPYNTPEFFEFSSKGYKYSQFENQKQRGL